MAQPINQRENHPALGKLDTARGEFWLNNPWQQDDHNLSAFERNRVLLNTGKRSLIDVSHQTTADLDSDSRAVVAGDFTGDGMPDLLVRSVGGGALRLFENRWPQTHWLRVSLAGVKSNSLGIGAKLRIEAGGQVIWRDLFPVCSYQSQLPAEVHVGLGKHQRVDRLTVYWPAGQTQRFDGIPADRHVLLTEGKPGWKPFARGAAANTSRSGKKAASKPADDKTP